MVSLPPRLAALVIALSIGPALAAPPHARTAPSRAPRHGQPTPPKRIGKFEDWQAAVHQEGGQTVCYAFTRPTASAPSMHGRGDAVLTVTERPGGRDAVALSAGFAYPQNAEAEMVSEGVTLPFYTAGRSAFARDGRAAVAMFTKGRSAQIRSPGARGQMVTDTFSLLGFTQAYAAINKACPAK